MSAERPQLTPAYSRPSAWIADATLDDTRAFVERCRRTWPATPATMPREAVSYFRLEKRIHERA
jgi:hypothetical protein